MYAPLRCDVHNKHHLSLQLRHVEYGPVWLLGLEVIKLGHFVIWTRFRSGGSGGERVVHQSRGVTTKLTLALTQNWGFKWERSVVVGTARCCDCYSDRSRRAASNKQSRRHIPVWNCDCFRNQRGCSPSYRPLNHGAQYRFYLADCRRFCRY